MHLFAAEQKTSPVGHSHLPETQILPFLHSSPDCPQHLLLVAGNCTRKAQTRINVSHSTTDGGHQPDFQQQQQQDLRRRNPTSSNSGRHDQHWPFCSATHHTLPKAISQVLVDRFALALVAHRSVSALVPTTVAVRSLCNGKETC